MLSKRQSPNIWEKLFVIFGFLILAEAFRMVLPAWGLFRAAFFGLTFVVAAFNFEQIVQGLLKIPWLVCLCALAAASFYWSENPNATLSRTVALAVSLLFAVYFATCFKERERFQILGILAAIFLIGSFVFIFALPAYGMQGDVWRGIFAQKNVLGRAMVITALIAITYQSTLWRVRMLRLAAYVLAIFAIFMADSMTSVLMVVSMTLLSLVLRAFWLGRVPGLAFASVAVVPITLMIIFAVTVDTNQVLISLGRNPTLTGRTDIWMRLDYAIAQKPVLGHGYGGFFHNWGATYGDLWSPYDNFTPGSAHNTYYNIVVELGYAGLILFAISAFFIAIKALTYLVRKKTPRALLPMLYMAYLLGTGFSEDFILFNTIGWVLYISFAVTLSVRDTAPEQASKRKERTITGLYPVVRRPVMGAAPPLSKD